MSQPEESNAKPSRRRQIDPTTCERDYSSEEIEFMNALDNYKRSSGRMFPTCSEILEVLLSLGYTKKDADSVETPTDLEVATDPIFITPALALEEEEEPVFFSSGCSNR